MIIFRTFGTKLHIGRRVAIMSGAALLLGACTSASGASSAPTAGSAATPGGQSSAAGTPAAGPVGAPVAVPGNGGGMVTGGAAGGMPIAYPYPGYPGTPGLAPDHTIVVTGFGHAPLAPDQSNRAATQQVALKAALADAKAQADLVASATGVTIQGVLSISVSSSPSFIGPVPFIMGAGPGGPAPGGPGAPMPGGPQIPPTPELAVSVTVAYRIG